MNVVTPVTWRTHARLANVLGPNIVTRMRKGESKVRAYWIVLVLVIVVQTTHVRTSSGVLCFSFRPSARLLVEPGPAAWHGS